MRKYRHIKTVGICIIIFTILFISIWQNKSEADTNKIVETNKKQVVVGKETILKTLTTNGEVESSKLEKLYLNTSYSYLTLCVEENEQVIAGQNLLKYTNGTYITAPYDCVIVSYSLPKVNSICTSSNYIYIASTNSLNMNINVNEEQINNISVGQEVQIIPNYDESKIYKGVISKINEIGSYQNGITNFSAIATIENDGNLKLGMSATCTITIEKLEDVIAIPIEAVEIKDDNRYVNKIANNEIEKVEVQTGKANENYVQIISGLSVGDRVEYETTTVTVTSSKNETQSKSLFDFGENSQQHKQRGSN